MSSSIKAGQNPVQAAKALTISLPDYLTLAIDTEKGDFKGSKLNGFIAALAHLGLPTRDDYANGILLQAASDTFQTYPGTRAPFTPLIDAILKRKYGQDNTESTAQIIAQSRG